MTSTLQNKVVLITGGARGIGEATATTLIERGATVALVDLDGTAAKNTAARLGPRAHAYEADVTDAESINRVVDQVAADLGGIDFAVAGAGIAGPVAPFVEADPLDFDQVLDINLMGVIRTARAVLPYVRDRQGYLLVIASIAASIPTPTLAGYGASKAGVEAFGRALRIELAPHRTAVGVAYFGLVETGLIHDTAKHAGLDSLIGGLPGPVGRPIPASQAAAAIVRGIEHRKAQVFAPGWVGPVVALRTELRNIDRGLHRWPTIAKHLGGVR